MKTINIHVFPNPMEEFVFIEYASSNQSLPPINIYNIQGQKVITAMVQPNQSNKINVAALPAGIYILKADYFTQKLIKK